MVGILHKKLILPRPPNPGYHSGLAMLSFVVFAIFAYGGIEAVGGLVDKTEKPEKNFAKGIVFAAIVISIGYSLAIFFMGRQH
ncbi:amino acid permease [Salmonella enterica subsp. enterica]|uniref:Amino acid permease n=1 Tax=Salmonella enterica I TaxID=59201 RepID=A0A447TP94_SALET|nr:amino acid permease [Salmonella enterica subsp. enterica]